MSLSALLLLASLLQSTTYGHGELMCGDPGKARICDNNAVTASGERLDTESAQVAIAANASLVLRARWIGLRIPGGDCKRVRLTDKMNERYVGKRGFDLTPGAVKLLTGKPGTKHWTGRVELCQLRK